MRSGSEFVERALAVAALPCVAVFRESSEANLRWAANALTTNGEMSTSTLTVPGHRRRGRRPGGRHGLG